MKVSPMRVVTQFNVKEKLSPSSMGAYEILEKVEAVAYCFYLPTEFYRINNVFHMSLLKKSFGDQTLAIIDPESIPLQSNLTNVEKLVQIIDWKERNFVTARFHWSKHYGRIIMFKKQLGRKKLI